MKTTAISLPRLTSPSLSSLTARMGDFVALMKPRVMLLAVFTALVGFMIPPGHLDALHASIANRSYRRGEWCRRRPQYVVRGRHRRRDDSHRHAANPARQDLTASFRVSAMAVPSPHARLA